MRSPALRKVSIVSAVSVPVTIPIPSASSLRILLPTLVPMHNTIASILRVANLRRSNVAQLYRAVAHRTDSAGCRSRCRAGLRTWAWDTEARLQDAEDCRRWIPRKWPGGEFAVQCGTMTPYLFLATRRQPGAGAPKCLQMNGVSMPQPHMSMLIDHVDASTCANARCAGQHQILNESPASNGISCIGMEVTHFNTS